MHKQNSSFDHMAQMQQISYGAYQSETGEILYASTSYDETTKSSVSQIILEHPKTGVRRTFATGKIGVSCPSISPDGTRLAYTAVVPNQGMQIFVQQLDGGSETQLTTMRFGAMEPIWSSDGKQILFTSTGSDSMNEDWAQTVPDANEQAVYQRERAKQPVVITDFGYKFDGLGFAQPEVMHLWVVPACGGKARRITSGNANFMHPNWGPDSRSVICESDLYCEKGSGIATDLLSIDLESLNITRVTKDRFVVSYPNPVRPVYTPDGKYIIIGILGVDGMNEESGYPACYLHRVSVDGSEVTKIFEQSHECFDSVQFPYNAACGRGLEKVQVSSDGEHVLFVASCNGESRVWKVAIYGDDHKAIALTKGKFAYNGIGKPANGKVLVARTEPHCPEAYYLLDENTGELELMVQSAKAYMENTQLSKVDDFFFKTLDGESMVHGFCMPPQGAQKGEKYPTILYVHGGPHPFYTYGFDLEMQSFAGEGFGVIYCNPRGSSGYGDVHRNLKRAFDGSAYTDIMQFVTEACMRCDWIDENRLGMTGGSYGGYMTNYTATRPNRFKAFITQRSLVNNLIDYASSDMQGNSKAFPTFGEFMVNAVEKSVICGMEKVKSPFLIMHGVDDLRCPVEGAHQLFVALKDSHAEDFPIKMVLYPHTSHCQPRHPVQQKHYYSTMVDWFSKYL